MMPSSYHRPTWKTLDDFLDAAEWCHLLKLLPEIEFIIGAINQKSHLEMWINTHVWSNNLNLLCKYDKINCLQILPLVSMMVWTMDIANCEYHTSFNTEDVLLWRTCTTGYSKNHRTKHRLVCTHLDVFLIVTF